MSAKSRVAVKCPECKHAFIPSKEEVQSRAGASSRRKGAAFENRLAKRFAKWWPGGYEFKRTPMSGGSALKIGWGLAGDIATTAPDFPWHLELKNAPGSFAGLHQFYTASNGALWKWLDQAKTECPENKTPLLIFNRFDQPTYCAQHISWDNTVLNKLQAIGANYFTYMEKERGMYVIWCFDDMLNSDPGVWKV